MCRLGFSENGNGDTTSNSRPVIVDESHQHHHPHHNPSLTATTAAVALAQLHNHHLSDWDLENMDTRSDGDFTGGDRSTTTTTTMQKSIELPPLRDHFKQDSSLPSFHHRHEILPPILNSISSPPAAAAGRSSTLPPLQRRSTNNNHHHNTRPRKSSFGRNNKGGKHHHERTKSKDHHARHPSLGDRKAMSAEPQAAAWAQGKRWEDLIEAATSATEADEDRYSEVHPYGSPTTFYGQLLTSNFSRLAAPRALHRFVLRSHQQLAIAYLYLPHFNRQQQEEEVCHQ